MQPCGSDPGRAQPPVPGTADPDQRKLHRANGSFSLWTLTHPSKGEVTDVGFEEGATTYLWDIYSTDPIGNQKFVPMGAVDPADQPLTQNTPATTVKLAAGAWISSARTADVVTLKGTSLLYSVSKQLQPRWSGRW